MNTIYKITLIMIILLGLAMVFIALSTSQEKNRISSFYKSETDSLRIEIAYKQKQIDSLKTVLRVHDDTIFVIERQKPIITNKYYYDEKVYLTSSDSANYELRLLNQRQFEIDYFNGRFNPKD